MMRKLNLSTGVMVMLCAAMGSAVMVSACGGAEKPAPKPAPAPMPAPDPEPEGPPEPEAVETGSDCVKAMSVCDGGLCDAEITNSCKTAVTCQLEVRVLCRSSTSAGEARGKGRATVPAGEATKLQAAGDCEGGQIVATQVVSLSCK